MDHDQIVKTKQTLPAALPLPGDKIQVQRKIGGGRKQINVDISLVKHVNITYVGEDERFQRIASIETFSGENFTHDIHSGEWWHIYNGNAHPADVFVL